MLSLGCSTASSSVGITLKVSLCGVRLIAWRIYGSPSMTRIFTLWFLRIVFASNDHALSHGKILPFIMLRNLAAQYEIDRLDMAIEV